MYSGVISWYPNPIYSGQTEQFWIEIRNAGSVILKVTNVQFKTDWAVAYYATDVPQIIDIGSSYKFGPLSVPIPLSTTGPHTFNVDFWVESPNSSGGWSQETEQHLGTNTIDINQGPLITGNTTIVMPTQTFTCDANNCYLISEGRTLLTLTQAGTLALQSKEREMNESSYQTFLVWIAALASIIAVVGVIAVLILYRRLQATTKREAKP
jgi:hypothetical protein